MDNLLQKFRTPIISFCIGVLFSVIVFWIYLEKDSDARDDSIIVRSSGTNATLEEGENRDLGKVYVGGAVVESKLCEVNFAQSLFEQIESCVEFSNADIEALKLALSADIKSPDYESFIIVATKSDAEPVVAGVATSKDSIVGDCVNINSASTKELESLPGIGAAYAQRIVEGRPYSSKTDIKKVKGIGDKTYAKFESLICL